MCRMFLFWQLPVNIYEHEMCVFNQMITVLLLFFCTSTLFDNDNS